MNFADQFTAHKTGEDTSQDAEKSDLSGQSVNADVETDVAPANQGFSEDKGDLNSQPDLDYVGPPKTVDVPYAYPSHADPERAKDKTGIYLDDVQRRDAEIVRARVEGREPDLENPPATQGTPLMPVHQVESLGIPGAVIQENKKVPVVVGVGINEVSANSDAAAYRERMEQEGTPEHEQYEKDKSDGVLVDEKAEKDKYDYNAGERENSPAVDSSTNTTAASDGVGHSDPELSKQ